MRDGAVVHRPGGRRHDLRRGLQPVRRQLLEQPQVQRLEPEAKIRAEISKSDPARAVQILKDNLEGRREHIRKRREFLLAQDEIKTVGK